VDPIDIENTAQWRREVLERLASIDKVNRTLETFERDQITFERRVSGTERDIVKLKTVLFGDPDAARLRDGDRGGLVDLFRETRGQIMELQTEQKETDAKFARTSRLTKGIYLLVIVNVIALVKDIPPVVWKPILSLFK
jgi:hypothetical protein